MANVKISELPLGTLTSTSIFPFVDEGTTYQGAISAITSNSTVEVTYSELVDKITGGTLNTGSYYIITDFRTCYDQPDFNTYGNEIIGDNYKQADIDPIVVLATSPNTISTTAYQPSYPKDRIQYDWTFSATERTQGIAYGRISERIDEFNNRTDYDHRTILFKRYYYVEIDFNSPYDGTVAVTSTSFTEMSVTGTDTNFTSLSTGQYVGFRYNNDFRVFEITSIDSDTSMVITGLTNTNTGSGIEMFPANVQTNTSYYQNNITTAYTEVYTFDYGNTNLNNYVGNFANMFNYDENPFILANNVFLGSTYRNNTFGNSCYNNTFDDDCENNTIGNYFYNNITDDDFDGNLIGNWFYNNKITSNFQYNRIGENFNNNYLVQRSFYRNNIMNYFNNNIISGGDFQNNEIGSQFNDNVIRNGQFYKNDIGNGYNNNKVYYDFYGNLIGNGFNANNIYCEFSNNTIGEYYASNNLGDINDVYSYVFNENTVSVSFLNNTIFSDFYKNKVGVNFQQNSVSGQTTNNVIGNQFENNTIYNNFQNNKLSDDFKGNMMLQSFEGNNVDSFISGNQFSGNAYNNNIGAYTFDNDFLGAVSSNNWGDAFYGNTIGYDFINNSICSNFYSNTIGSGFQYNTIGHDFNNNDIGDNFGYGYSSPQGNKIGNAFYGNFIGEYFYNNTISDNFFNITVGNLFQWNNVNTSINGVGLYSCVLYSSTTVNLFTNNGGDTKLSYFDDMDILNVESINETTCVSFTITSSDFTNGGEFYQNTTALGVNGVDGFENTAPENWLGEGYYGQGLSGTSLSQLTTAYNLLGFALGNTTGYLWNVTWGPGSSIPSGVVKFGANVNNGYFNIQAIDTSDTDYLIPNNNNGTSLVGTFYFPATFTIYLPLTNKSGWC